MAGCLMNDELEELWKEEIVTSFKYCRGVDQNALKRVTETLTQDSGYWAGILTYSLKNKDANQKRWPLSRFSRRNPRDVG
jgi:hypothetical protein